MIFLQRGNQEPLKKHFDDKGKVKGAQPVDRLGLSSEFFMPGLDEVVRQDFILFMKSGMTNNPSKRPLPRETLQLPW